MGFREPRVLFLLLVVPLFGFLLWFHFRQDKRLFKRLHNPAPSRRPFIFLGFLATILIGSLTVYLAGPRLEKSVSRTIISGGGDYILLVDVSYSMAARPSPDEAENLQHVRQIMHTLVDRFPKARFRIVGFSTFAFPLSSLSGNRAYLHETIDRSVVVKALVARDSDLPNALAAVAREKMQNSTLKHVRNIILFSDGQMASRQNPALLEAFELLEKSQLRVTAVGIGSTAGYRIPIYDEHGHFTGSYERYSAEIGTTYLSRLKAENLQHIANKTGGSYFFESQVDSLTSAITETLSRPAQGAQHLYQQQVVATTDIGWIFFSIFTLAFIVFLFFFRRVY